MMMPKEKKVLILGGYGNFGARIAHGLAKSNIAFVIVGRDRTKAENAAYQLKKKFPNVLIEVAVFDVNTQLRDQLLQIKPMVVINTCGPFQKTDYRVAQQCIEHQVHYIDLSDGRDFVTGITALDADAKKSGILVVSGASTVPGLSSAVLDEYRTAFSSIESLIFGIAPGAKAPRGLATTQAILSYVGKPLKTFPGFYKKVYGWQDIYRQDYPMIGKRWMANCDIPDLDLFPARYGIKTMRFSAGMESFLLHGGIWLLSWCVRLGIPLNLEKHAAWLLTISHYFDALGTSHGGMHMIMKGVDNQGHPKEIRWFIIAWNGDGPYIPTIPAIILAKRWINEGVSHSGAIPCMGLFTLDEYKNALLDYDVKIFSDEKLSL